MTKKAISISPSKLIGFLKQQLNNLPDSRTGSNKKYPIEDAVIAAFSVFFTQCPSFLEHQKLIKKKKGKDNAQSLFGLSKIPCDNQIRTLLDPIPAKTVFGTFETVWKWLDKNQIINQFKYLDNQILLALDGTEYYCSKKIKCPQCNCRHHRDGSTTYYHQVMTPVIVAPDKKQVLNLEPEFISSESGKTKEDCENAAVKRWLRVNPAHEKNYKITLLGDDLYSRQPVCELSLKQGYNFIFVAKASSHKGYNLEHNFGHGQENLSEILLSLNLLGFLFHNVLELVNNKYQMAREKLEKRKTFFNDIRALVKYEWFKDWSELFVYIISEGESKNLVNTS